MGNMPEGTTAEAGASTEASTDASTATTETVAQNTDDTTGINTEAKQGDLFEGKDTNGTTAADTDKAKVADAKAKEEADAKTKEDASNTNADSKDSDKGDTTDPQPKTLEEMGFGNMQEDQQAAASLATEMGVTFDDIQNSLVDGQLDVTKLKDLSARDAQLLKTVVDAEISKLTTAKNDRRVELHGHVGGKENFEAMVKWVNSETKTNVDFKKEVGELVGNMKQGGVTAKLAVDSLFSKFQAAPNTAIHMKTSEEADVSANPTQQTRRQERNAKWQAFQDTHNKSK